jgi:hypothetical protein
MKHALALFCITFAFGTVYAASGVGMATGTAAFSVNGSAVNGTATLFDGATVRTDRAPSRVQLSGGATFQLSPSSQAKVFANRIVLEAGYGDFRTAGAARVEARGLSIAAAEAGSQGRVAVHGNNLVQVASAKGVLRVYNAAGIPVANVRAGTALDFDPQTGSSATNVSGCLMKKDGKWVVYDEVSQALYELLGTGFDKEWGNRVEVSGTARSGSGSMQAIQVGNLKHVSDGGCLTVASQTNSQLPGQQAATTQPTTSSPTNAPAPKPSGGGMSAGTKVAIAVVIIGAGAGAGIGLAGHGGNRS